MGSIRDRLEDEEQARYWAAKRKERQLEPDRWVAQGMWVVDLHGDAAFKVRDNNASAYAKAMNKVWRDI